MKTKIILSLHIADELIKKGFPVIEVKPSRKVRGRVAFVFELTPEFDAALTEISGRRKIKL